MSSSGKENEKPNRIKKSAKLKKGGDDGCSLSDFKITSPVGTWDILLCEQGLHFVKLEKDKYYEINASVEVQPIPDNAENRESNIYAWMKDYFERPERCLYESLPAVCPSVFSKDNFRQKAWMYIYKHVGFGATISYGDLAGKLGLPGAAQAVGSAMRNNPVSIVIPCHRVIRSGGAPGHYSGGTRDNLKIWLLNHESEVKGKSGSIKSFFSKKKP